MAPFYWQLMSVSLGAGLHAGLMPWFLRHQGIGCLLSTSLLTLGIVSRRGRPPVPSWLAWQTLTNAPATFQAVMNDTLRGLKNCVVYMDDILIHSATAAEHAVHLRAVLERLRTHRFFCKAF